MSRRLAVRLLSWAPAAMAGVLVLSCGEQGPHLPVAARFDLAPGFASDLAGIVPIAKGRFVLTRVPSGDVAKDTVIDLPADQDSVDLSLKVMLLDPDETFMLTIALVTPAGDTAFRAGPIEVHPSTGGVPTPIQITLVYTGVGADAAFVVIGTPGGVLVAGDTVRLTGTAYDSVEAAIPGTPIGWRSLDPAVAAVPFPDSGLVVGVARGTARIVARLLTGPADTVPVDVILPPATIVADSGSGQTGPAGSVLPNRLVARVRAADGVGVADVWVKFAVTLGGGAVSADSGLTDANGRAGVTWTLGDVVGAQTVTAMTRSLPAASAVFNATSTATGPGAIAIVAGSNQSALVGTAVTTAPRVRVTDAQGNPVPAVAVTFAIIQGGGTVTGPVQTTDASGLATVGSWTLGPNAGLNALTAAVSGLTPVQFLALGTAAGGVTQMTLSAGDGQTALAHTAVPIAPAVLLRDTSGAVISGVTVTFTVTAGGGGVTGGAAVSNAAGVATVGTWTLGSAGANTLRASLTGLPDVVFQATGTVGAPDTVVIVSGDAQSADAGTTLPQPLVVEVRDSAGNPVPAVAVTWATIYGSVSPTTGATDASGRTQTSWTLGTNSLTQTATASATGLTPAVFSASAVFPNPTILLALAGTDRVRLGDSAQLNVTLTAPAPAGGVDVVFTVDNPAVLGLGTTRLSVPQDGTGGQITVHGLASGTTTVRATASGYANGAVSVLVTVQVLSMPTSLNVPFGGTASLPLQISTPAPAGGVVVTLVSDNPAAVGVQTPTVTIAQGQTTANAIVIGVAPGAATVTGSTTDFGIDQTAATTRANLNIVEGSSTIAATLLDTLTVRLESSGLPVAAPGSGLVVTLTPRDPRCVAATSPITIPGGLVSAPTIISYGGGATTPCNTYLVATAPSIDPDSAYIVVNPPPGISLSAYTLGAGLQRYADGTLGATNHGGVSVKIKSSNPALLRVAPDENTAGGDSVVQFLANGQNYFTYYIQAMDGVADTGVASVAVTVTATGFTPGSATHVIRPAVFDLYGVPATTTTLSDSTPFYAYVGYALTGSNYIYEYQDIRAGGQPLTVTLINDSLAVGDLVTSTAGRHDTVTVQIPVGSYYSPSSVSGGGVAFVPRGPGVTTISASAPGVGQLFYYGRQVTVTAPGITTYQYTVGAGLQRAADLYLGAANHGGDTVVITSDNPAVLLVAPDQSTPGTASIKRYLPNGQTYLSYYIQGVEGVADTGVATASVTVGAAGFTNSTATQTIRPAVFDLYGVPQTTTTLSDSTAFYAYVGYTLSGYNYIVESQVIRAGGQALTVTLVNDSSAVGDLVEAGGVRGDTLSVQIPVGSYYSPTTVASGGIAYDPSAPGITTITASVPGLTELAYYNRTVNVTAPGITVYPYTLGAGLQRSADGYLGAANHGGVSVVVKSTDPSLLRIAASPTTVGGDSIVLAMPNGQTYFTYYLQAVEGVADTGAASAPVLVSAPGFASGSATHTIRQPAFQLENLPTSTTTLSDSSALYVQIGYTQPGGTYLYESQDLRAGAAPLTVTLINSTPGVGQLIGRIVRGPGDTLITRGDTALAQIPPLNYYTQPWPGALSFEPLTAGTTTVTASIPGYAPTSYAARSVSVTAPGISLYETTVGAGLQDAWYGYLGASDHGGVNVVVKSSAPSVARVSPDVGTPGTDSIVIFVPDGQTYFGYYVQGMEGQTGTVTITARASGFTDGTTALNVVTPAVGIYGLPGSVSLGQAPDSVAFYAEIGIPNVNNQSLVTAQLVRAGVSALTVTLTSSAPGVGELVTSSQRGASVTVQIPTGLYYSPTSVSTGGAAFKKLTQGSTVVGAAIPGFITLSLDGLRTVMVTP
jgi:hypothetical protein